jgi:sulfotransferase family protein
MSIHPPAVVRQMVGRLRRRFRATRMRAPIAWYRHRAARINDVFLASYPRSGNTWMRFLLWELISGQTADFDTVETAVPYIGLQSHGVPVLLPNGGRLFKTHEPYRGDYRKAVYLVRDPRDVAVSNYERERGHLGDVDYGLEHFLGQYIRGQTSSFGSWQTHTQSWLNSPLFDQGEMILIKYEDLHSNPERTLARVADFLELKVDSSAIRNAVLNNTLSNMRLKEDRRVGKAAFAKKRELLESERLVRQGIVGGWSKRLTKQQSKLIENHAGTFLQDLGYDCGKPKTEHGYSRD